MVSNLPTIHSEDDYINEEAGEDVGFGRILSFAKGEYTIDKTPVKEGSEFRVHYRGWIKVWINFTTAPPTQRLCRIGGGEKPPERNTLGDTDQSLWEEFNGKPKDPWVLQFLMPFENTETGETVAFRTSSFGGRRAPAGLAPAGATRARHGEPSLPTVALAVTSFSTKSFGKIQKPHFVIRGWEDVGGPEGRDEIVEKIGGVGKPERNGAIHF